MIYLATPLFNDAARDYAERLVCMISRTGHIVYYPWRDAGDAFYRALSQNTTDNDWCTKVCAENVAALRRCSFVLAVLDGSDVDSGVAWEVGFARALGKPVFGLRSDFRMHAHPGLSVNLMVANSCKKTFSDANELLEYLEAWYRLETVTVTDLSSFYNAIADEYDDEVLHPHTASLRRDASMVAEALSTPINPACTLDIGAGTSDLISRVQSRIKVVVEPAIGMIKARNDRDKVVCISAPIERFIPPRDTIDRAFCVLAVDHMESPRLLLEQMRGGLRIGADIIIVYQDPDEELSRRRDPNFFEFYSSVKRILYRVPSDLKHLADFDQHIPEGYRVLERKRHASKRFGVSSLIGIRCVRMN